MITLTGQAALVTGAGASPGREIALALADAGAAVALNDPNPDRLDQLVEQIQARDGRAMAFAGDVSKRFMVSTMLEALRDAFGGLQILVNAMLIDKRADLLDLDEYDWQRVIEINLGGAFHCTQLAARVMADEGGGVIVNVASGAALRVHANGVAHAASQSGLIGFTREAARALAPRGVRVNALVVDVPGSLPVALNAAQVVLFLCSQGAQGVVGQTLVVGEEGLSSNAETEFESHG